MLAQKSEPISSTPRSYAESKNRFEQMLKNMRVVLLAIAYNCGAFD
ncbi:hypothetical protein [Floridanema evergladense]|uniref:Uncharacterized protein n=1 Tax=Floridaenema evergladense BLCC-F167 TaxID=3153639 RepID=A0ABV4WTB8_9CYAN